MDLFARSIPEYRTPRSCRICLKPASTEVYRPDVKGQKANMSSRLFVCSEHTPAKAA